MKVFDRVFDPSKNGNIFCCEFTKRYWSIYWIDGDLHTGTERLMWRHYTSFDSYNNLDRIDVITKIIKKLDKQIGNTKDLQKLV